MIELEGHFIGSLKIYFVYLGIRTNGMIDMSRVAKNTVASDFSDAAFLLQNMSLSQSKKFSTHIRALFHITSEYF